ncbi:CG14147 [Drosophila busckii]|uniref:CG14147 n=1 Tax=Drosophila busckii TaxID=30019 RepID=A0A0M3QWJ8_DROBS|nr:CG14147 [Drosophila busckii]
MQFFICTLAILGVAQAGLLPHLEHHDHHDHHDLHNHHAELSHLLDADVHHSDGIHLGHSSAVVIDGAEHHLDSLPHPVYHHDGYAAHVDHTHIHEHVHAPAKIVSHEPIHEVHHHSHAAVVHRAVVPAHLDVHSHANLLAFAKHHLHGKYGKVRITETHY